MTILNITASVGPIPKVSSKDSLDKAAAGFEAIFVRQMLSAARNASAGDSTSGSEAQTTFKQMLDEQFAEIAAQNGAFGIGTMLKAQLSAKEK